MSSIQENIKNCAICNEELQDSVKIDINQFVQYKCKRCGFLKIHLLLVYSEPIYKRFPNEYLLISGLIRKQYENTREIITINSEQKLIDLLHSKVLPSQPYEIAMNLLYILCGYSEPGAELDLLAENTLYKILTLSYLKNTELLDYYLKYLHEQNRLVYRFIDTEQEQVPRDILITMSGWKQYHDRLKIDVDSKQVFVAMSFSEEMDEIFIRAIRPAIISSGYEPYRIDKIEHNKKICDLIITEVRKSRFVIADITSHKKGVYFEAGYAMGLGLPVIWCCQDDEEQIRNMHFDTRQYNHILWKDIEDYKTRLEIRIKSTITK
jgi:nucleoside 2-deoxyribosyltransferase